MIISCNKTPFFGVPGGKAQHCGPHKEEGEMNVVSKTCEVPRCPIRPSFAQPGEKKKRCAVHRIGGDIDVVNKTCEFLGCRIKPSFAQPGKPKKRCSAHKIADDVDVVSTTCEVPGCPMRPCFAQPGNKKKRCASHRIVGDFNVIHKTCEFQGCPVINPNFAQPGESGKRCSGHRITGDTLRKSMRCQFRGCPLAPSFGQPGETRKRCSGHRIDNDIDVSRGRCQSEACLFYDQIEDMGLKGFATYINPKTGMRDMCYSCHLLLYPKLHAKLTVRKEHFILAEIQRQLPELEPYFLVWDCPLACTRKMPDMAWGVKDTLIHVEVDEGGEDHEDNTLRIVDIHAASNLKNHVLIRFNPDKTVDGAKPCLKRSRVASGDRVYRMYEPEWNKRIPVLIESVRKALHEATGNKNVDTNKRKLFF